MAPALDANLGTVTGAASLTTGAAAAADTRIVVVVWWYVNAVTLQGLNGGGLEWIVDAQFEVSGDDHHLAFVSAYAPGGLVSGVTLTPVFSAAATPSIAAASFTGLKDGTSGYVDVATAGQSDFNATWTTQNLVTTNADDLLLGITLNALGSASTHAATSPATELHEWNASGGGEFLATVYRIVSSTSTYVVGGVWDQTPALEANIGIAYMGGTPSAARTDVILVKPEKAQGLTLVGGTSAWAFGSYVDLFPAAEVDNDLVILGATWAYADFGISGADATREYLTEIATGAAASEVTKIQIPWTVRWDTAVAHPLRTQFTHWLPEPFYITAGTRVSVRIADPDSSAITTNGFKVFYRLVAAVGGAASLVWQPAAASLYNR